MCENVAVLDSNPSYMGSSKNINTKITDKKVKLRSNKLKKKKKTKKHSRKHSRKQF